MARQTVHLLLGANAEAGAHGHVGRRTHAVEVAGHLFRHGHVLARGARHGHGIDEALRGAAQTLEARLRRHRRHHLDERQALARKSRFKVRRFFMRQVRHDEPADARRPRSSRQLVQPVRQQRIQVAHQQQRRLGATRQCADGGENPRHRHALRQCGTAGQLDGGTVRHGVRKGHADFHHVGSIRHLQQIFGERFQLGKTGCHERHEGRTTSVMRGLDGLADAFGRNAHQIFPFNRVRWSVGMSLSPRPERQMRMRLPGLACA